MDLKEELQKLTSTPEDSLYQKVVERLKGCAKAGEDSAYLYRFDKDTVDSLAERLRSGGLDVEIVGLEVGYGLEVKWTQES